MLEIRGLTRRFGDRTAVDDIAMTVPSGELVGFVGGNGAGKSTTMRMVMGVLEPDAGQIRWNGAPVTPADRRRFGYMPEERGLYPKQPVLAQLVYLGRLQGLDAGRARRSAQELLERFDLAARGGDKLESLSLGNQQRVQIAAAVIADPRLLVLDEPFSGLDPTAVDSMAELLQDHAARGAGVLFSSHQLDLVERLCDRLVVLHAGRVVAAGTVEELRTSAGVRHRLRTGSDASWVRGLGWLQVDDVHEGSAVVRLADPEDSDRLLREAAGRGRVYELSTVVPTLAEVFREVAA
ncbi:ABC transporter ATP-binding protein [Kineococcus rhizosphaerae]|nr:ATP-binding cassette domain-containing protein [Kineococcus rhizosphaerae]